MICCKSSDRLSKWCVSGDATFLAKSKYSHRAIVGYAQRSQQSKKFLNRFDSGNILFSWVRNAIFHSSNCGLAVCFCYSKPRQVSNSRRPNPIRSLRDISNNLLLYRISNVSTKEIGTSDKCTSNNDYYRKSNSNKQCIYSACAISNLISIRNVNLHYHKHPVFIIHRHRHRIFTVDSSNVGDWYEF